MLEWLCTLIRKEPKDFFMVPRPCVIWLVLFSDLIFLFELSLWLALLQSYWSSYWFSPFPFMIPAYLGYAVPYNFAWLNPSHHLGLCSIVHPILRGLIYSSNEVACPSLTLGLFSISLSRFIYFLSLAYQYLKFTNFFDYMFVCFLYLR